MVRPVLLILISVLVLFYTSKELLLIAFEVLYDTKGRAGKDDLVVVLSEVEHVLVSISCEPINVVDLVEAVGLPILNLLSLRRLFSDLLQEELRLGFLLLFFGLRHYKKLIKSKRYRL